MLGEPHVESFNMIVNGGLQSAVEDIPPIEFALGKEEGAKRIKISFSNASMLSPRVTGLNDGKTNILRFPKECRIRAMTYKGQLDATIDYSIDGVKQQSLTTKLGDIPIMVRNILFSTVATILLLQFLTPSS